VRRSGLLGAGAHLNPTSKKHGKDNPEGPHAGDLLNIEVQVSGVGKASLMDSNITLGDGPNSLFHEGGTAMVIHEKADDYKTDPAGNSGPRIACGVIERSFAISLSIDPRRTATHSLALVARGPFSPQLHGKYSAATLAPSSSGVGGTCTADQMPQQCSSVPTLFPVRPGVTLLFVFLSSEGFHAKALRALVADGDFRKLATHIANVVCVFGLGVGSQGNYLHALPPF